MFKFATPNMVKYKYIPGWCNGSTSASGAFSLGSSPSPGVFYLYKLY